MKPSPSTPSVSSEEEIVWTIREIILENEGLMALNTAEQILEYLRSKGLINNG